MKTTARLIYVLSEFVSLRPFPLSASRRRINTLVVPRLKDFRFKCFPVGTSGHEWVPERTPVGAKRSGACNPFPRNDSSSQGLGTWTNTTLVFDNLVSVQVKFLSD